MKSQLLPIIAIFSVYFVASHAALSPEAYWNSVLPNTVMPKSVKDLINPEWTEEKTTSVSVGKGGVHVNTGKGSGTSVNVGHGSVGVHTGKGTNVGVGHGSVGVHTGKGTNVGVGKGGVGVHTGKGTNVGAGKGGVGIHTGKGTNVGVGKGGVGVGVHTGKGTNVGVGKGGVSVGTGHKGKPVHVYVKPGPNPFNYNYRASETQLHDSTSRAVFFLEKDLKSGMSMRLAFTKNNGDATFLVRSESEKIPFSSKKMSNVLEIYNVNADSEEAQTMTETVKECEETAVKGEDKYCATSLESMVDFSTSKLGKNVRAISTEVDKETKLQKFTIKGVNKMKSNEAVVCHKQAYPYAVFYCHDTYTTRAYTVSLSGADGTNVNAVAVCHTDTSTWNPKHLAFQVLKVQPGTVPICHYLPQDHIVWIAN